MRNWSKPQQQSIMALVMLGIKFAKQIITVIWPLLIIHVFKKKNNPALFWGIGLGLTFLIIIIKSVLDFISFRFYVFNQELIIRSGILRKKVITIPLEKIQAVHLEQHFWHTLTGTTKVLIDTPGSEKAEVSIQALSTADAADFRQMIIAEAHQREQKNIAVSDTAIVKLLPKDLLLLSLSANHFETLGLILFFVLARLDDVKRIFDLDAFDWLKAHSDTVTFTWQLISAVVLGMLALAFVISIVRTVLRYFDLQVIQNEKGLTVKWGLLQIKQHIIPVNKIQLIEWRTNWVRKMLGLYLVQLKATGESANEKKKQKILIPTTKAAQTQAILDTYLTETLHNQPAATIQKVYVRRKLLLIGLPITIVVACIAAIWIKWYAAIFLIWLLYYYWSLNRFQKYFKFWIGNNGLQVSKGVWGKKQVIMNWEKIQLVTKTQSLFQQKNGFANLVIHTAGGSVTLPYLLLDEATTLQNFALYKVETSTINWM